MSSAALDGNARPAAGAAPAKLLVRHQIAAGIGTAADFGAMIALVELLAFAPPVATVISALTGGIVNFTTSRLWAFRRMQHGTLASQAMRYALSSAAGALLNALLLSLVLRMFHDAPYTVARAAVALVVSLAYTYPVHTRLVFRVADRKASSS